MDKWLVVVLAGCTVAGAWAQAASSPTQPERDPQQARQQKRLELRADVSSASRRTEPAAAAAQPTALGHQLTSHERAEMREQLRRFQPTAARPVP